jgi:hypothetical protein
MSANARIRLLVVDCGDVFTRHYQPALRALGDRVEICAEHARQGLDITLKAYASIADGRTHETGTTI